MQDFAHLLLAARLTTPLGAAAAQEIGALLARDPTLLDTSYPLAYLNSTRTGWDLAFSSGNPTVLAAMEQAWDGTPKSLTIPFPLAWKDKELVRALRLWIGLLGQNEQALLLLLTQIPLWQLPKAEIERDLFGLFHTIPLSFECMDRLAMWRLEKGCANKQTSKALAGLFEEKMRQDPTLAPALLERLVGERCMPHALPWLLALTQGAGLHIPFPNPDAGYTGLIQRAFRALQSGHQRLALLQSLAQDKSLLWADAKTLNRALRTALDTPQ
jgi:hypothetical protein